jgi:GntR family transcriptional regulator/MocR family aminotransferase
MIAKALSRDFADLFELVPSTTGLHLTALARGMSPDRIAAAARRAGERSVAVQMLSSFAVASTPRAGLMLGYGAIPTERIEEGLRLLRACFEP